MQIFIFIIQVSLFSSSSFCPTQFSFSWHIKQRKCILRKHKSGPGMIQKKKNERPLLNSFKVYWWNKGCLYLVWDNKKKEASLHGGRLTDLNYLKGLNPLPLTSQHWPSGRWYKSSSPVSSCKQNHLFIDSFSVLFSGAQSDCNSEPPINCKEK